MTDPTPAEVREWLKLARLPHHSHDTYFELRECRYCCDRVRAADELRRHFMAFAEAWLREREREA